jgi:hypothetical protein
MLIAKEPITAEQTSNRPGRKKNVTGVKWLTPFLRRTRHLLDGVGRGQGV